MNVYFVRHGQSEYNGKGLYQSPKIKLSKKGRAQVSRVAQRLLFSQIDMIVSSPHSRAKETAQIIGEKINRKVKYTYLLAEERRPSMVVGKNIGHSHNKKIRRLFFKKSHDYKWYYSDEENFSDLIGRAKRFLKYISKKKQKNIVVVTHSNFLKLIISTMMFGEKVSGDTYKSFLKFFNSENAGVTMCKINSDSNWRMVTWNDISHLNEKNYKITNRVLQKNIETV